MSPNNGKNIIDLNAVRAHKKDDREIQFTPQTSCSSIYWLIRTSTTSLRCKLYFSIIFFMCSNSIKINNILTIIRTHKNHSFHL